MNITVSKEGIYLPERLFFNKLFEYCRYSNEKFLEKINLSMQSDIINIAEKIHEHIDELPTCSVQSIYSKSFIDFINKNVYNDASTISYKMPDYFLTRCYESIVNAVPDFKLDKIKEIHLYDKNKLNDFCKYVEEKTGEDYGAVSLKQLNRLIYPCGKSFSRSQLPTISYIIRRMFPKELKEQNNLKNLCSNWKDIFSFCENQLDPSNRYLEMDVKFEKNAEELFNEKFNKIMVLTENNEEVGELLLEIFYQIRESYRKNYIHIIPTKNYSNKQNNQNENYFQETDNEKYMYNAELSSHIIGFIKWLPMISDVSFEAKELEFLKSIENVIDKIRNLLFNEYSSIFTYENLKKSKKGEVFIIDKRNDVNDNGEQMRRLRQMVIRALYNENYIKRKFEDCYTDLHH